MRQETKVVLLILSLIALIVICVFTHADKIILEKQNSNQVPKEIEKSEKKEESKSIKLPINEETEETAKEDIQSNIEVTKEEKSTEEVKEEIVEVKEELEQKIEEVVQEPLIKTNPKYIRRVGEKPIEELSRESQLLQIEINDYMKENPIIFQRASDKITKASFKTVKKIAQILKDNPNIVVEVAGHTDAAGAAKMNQTISTLRAISVKKLLINSGIDKNRLKARGYGENIPLVKNSAKGYSKVNRRVEFNIIEE